MRQSTTKSLSIWLSAILLLLSFSTSAHIAELDHDHDLISECTLCFSQTQLSQALLTDDFGLLPQKQVQDFSPCASYTSITHFFAVYHSRAPPVIS
ncbi:ABC-type zinc uptake system zinc chaperone [Shewanella maritima]|uniref:ABC-type zinc uptake system zinc chaperone n=1 Tax=Shewanella maritima TaxID=2520507 RepID=UPI0037350E2F